jgi:predicted CXXCH cytochrome family protein
MPPHLKQSQQAKAGHRPPYGLSVLTVLLSAAGMPSTGCLGPGNDAARREAARLYPPPPQTPRAVALGTLRGAPPPSTAEVNLTMFLFGAEPPPRLTIANPTGLAARDHSVWICDNALSAVFRWDAEADAVTEERYDAPTEHPVAIDLAPNGDRLICDRRGVLRIEPSGRTVGTYALSAGELRPGGVLAVGDAVWVSNLAQDRIEVFDADSGRHLRSIGERGRGPAQFALPRSMARTPDGNVCVVDMLNDRVQVLAPDGRWLRDIGGPGDSVGMFGRPKDVVVGPDGTIFVTDAFSQRVHAFAPDGAPLLAFGEPGTGVGELILPSGIAVSPYAPRTLHSLPRGAEAAYYILVGEQLNGPGIRVYAWLRPGEGGESTAPLPGEAVHWKPRFPQSAAINPHWDASRCTKCHQSDGPRLLPIPLERTDALCLSCHDGVQAPADPHPIGRPATTELVKAPADWPTVAGAIGCLTCHDIQRHCDPAAKRPAVNTILLRGYDPQRPLEYCSNCHGADVGGRFSPHRQRDAAGNVREDACLFCHTQRPEVPADGRRRFQPHLRTASSDLCLNCHIRHWDLSPLGHVDRPVTPRIREWILVRELSRTRNANLQELERLARDSKGEPARLPLGQDKVTCYTCHNPHYAGLFPPDSELGALATNPEDRRSALRTNWIELCSECHHH